MLKFGGSVRQANGDKYNSCRQCYFCTYKQSKLCDSVVTHVTRLETSRPTGIRMLGYVLLVKSAILVTVNI
jgi:hypothetical protein